MHGNSRLALWLRRALKLQQERLQCRIRGNNLHVLCEGRPCPTQALLLQRLLPALQRTDVNSLLPPGHPPLYQIFLYGREPGQSRPQWSAPIDLQQLNYHLEQLQSPQRQLSPASRRAGSRPASSKEATQSALQQSHLNAARQGNLEAIARYLSDTLSALGIATQVSAKTLPYRAPAGGAEALSPVSGSSTSSNLQRLWIGCIATYSPDASLLAEPLAQKLRDLRLDGFRDAIVPIQVVGEAAPDWTLRVDLTPPDEMLCEAARWGDVSSITRLLNKALAPLHAKISTASLRDSTLHLFCSRLRLPDKAAQPAAAPHQQAVKAALLPLFTRLAPQGIQAAMLYGQVPQQETPAWVEWLELPASRHPALAEPPIALARQGDWGAIAFLLHRLLNPDLNKQLATGGIRIQLLPKTDPNAPPNTSQQLLHVMIDAPVCPDQRQVSKTVVRFLRELQLPQLAGVRVYGRRAGQRRPLWSYGVDLLPRTRLVPEPAPEFAATDAYVGDLLTPGGELEHRPELSTDELQSAWARGCDRLLQRLRQALITSQLFAASAGAADAAPLPGRRDGAIALIWGAAGLLLAVQFDWGLSQLLQRQAAADGKPAAVAVVPRLELPESPSPAPAATPRSRPQGTVFDQSSFVSSDPTPTPSVVSKAAGSNISSTTLPYTPTDPQSQAAAIAILAEGTPYPTFNSQQLNDKLALYYARLEQWGHPPDVLIVGSSRALRGVDPAALQRELTAQGYDDPTVFNFAINGATAQVTDLILRQVLQPNQLPRLIIWADGARAFNSGAVDVTYSGITVSPGYRDLTAGRLERVPVLPENPATADEAPAPTSGLSASLIESYRSLDRWLSEQLASVSGTYAQRDRLKAWMLGQLAPAPEVPAADLSQSLTQPGRDLLDVDGFLPLALRFNPATYFQEYARVEGRYDNDYSDFRIQGAQASALQSLLAFTRDRQIPVVFVNLPLTKDYLDPVRRRYEQQFKQALLKESLTQPGFIFRDLGEIWLKEYDYFSDPSHLNRYGAYAISRRLAQDPMVPWAEVLQPTP